MTHIFACVRSVPLDSYFVSRAHQILVPSDGVLLGDFEVNDYRGNNATTAVFLAFTVLGVIILLNVLIAIVSDSYEKSKVGAKALFGKARIGFLAEHIALEQFLQPGQNPLAALHPPRPRAGHLERAGADHRSQHRLCRGHTRQNFGLTNYR